MRFFCCRLYYGPSEDSDQPAHSRSLIKIFTGRILDSLGYKVFHAEYFDQTARMRKLIWDSVGRTYQTVHFLSLRLICSVRIQMDIFILNVCDRFQQFIGHDH